MDDVGKYIYLLEKWNFLKRLELSDEEDSPNVFQLTPTSIMRPTGGGVIF